MDRENLYIRKADVDDIKAVCRLYKTAIGREGCTWNEYYPTLEDAENDLAHGCLYVAEINGKVVGAASLVPENELDDMECFRVKNKAKEIARVVVSYEHSGCGYAAIILKGIFEELKARDCKAVHLMVAKCNKPAISTYKKLDFNFVGECFMYDNDYYVCELVLEGEL